MHSFLQNIYLTILLLITYNLHGINAPPNITPYEAHLKAEEIFQAHISQKEFNTLVAKRTLSNFLEELDPVKSYLTANEINIYLNPSDELLKRAISGYEKYDFSLFQEMYELMLLAIERRNYLEEKVALATHLPQNVKAQEVIEGSWPKDENDLYNKLLKIRSLQVSAANKLASKKEYDLFFQRVTKRRINHEKDLITSSKIEKKKQVLAYFLKALASSLDSHTVYFTPQEAKAFLIQVQQRLFGIGAQLRDDLSGLTVVQIVEGGPAWQSGDLKLGDKIVGVNHEIIVGMDIQEAIDLIRGPKGTKVILTILRENEAGNDFDKFDIELTRDEIVLKESRYESRVEPYGDGVIGYIALHAFYQDPKHSSVSDLREAFFAMASEHKVYGLILDLRNNAGGLLPQAVEVTGSFIQNGVVAAIKDYSGQEQRLRNVSGGPIYSGPLIVLINRASASASEIVALCLSDYGRALIVGDKTSYGKGSYQTFTIEGSNPNAINESGEYKVTRGRYYTVSGNTPQLVGVPSHIEVPGILSEMEIGEKYSKYPLENHSIAPLYADDYSDVHPLYRMRLKKLVGKDIQKKETKLLSSVDTLSKYSKKRIRDNPNYVQFLSALKHIDKYELDYSLVGQNDLQLEEAYNIMKDLIVLNIQK